MKNLIVLISLLLFKMCPENKPIGKATVYDGDVFYKLILDQITPELIKERYITFSFDYKFPLPEWFQEGFCAQIKENNNFIIKDECEIIKDQFKDYEHTPEISKSLQEKLTEITEKSNKGNSEKNWNVFLFSKPIFLNNDKVFVFVSNRYKYFNTSKFMRGGKEIVFIFKKENKNWILEKTQGLVDY